MTDEKKPEKKAGKAKDPNTTDTNAGPDADFGDGEYHNTPAPKGPRVNEQK